MNHYKADGIFLHLTYWVPLTASSIQSKVLLKLRFNNVPIYKCMSLNSFFFFFSLSSTLQQGDSARILLFKSLLGLGSTGVKPKAPGRIDWPSPAAPSPATGTPFLTLAVLDSLKFSQLGGLWMSG